MLIVEMKTYRTVQQKGFTLIELLVVIAILGILAAGLLFTIDPLDKINSANDSTAIQTIAQLGRANDAYEVNHGNTPVAGTSVANAVTALYGAGEIKYSSVSFPNVNYANTYATNGTSYIFSVKLQSKKYTTPNTPYYIYMDGKACAVGSVPAIGAANPC